MKTIKITSEEILVPNTNFFLSPPALRTRPPYLLGASVPVDYASCDPVCVFFNTRSRGGWVGEGGWPSPCNDAERLGHVELGGCRTRRGRPRRAPPAQRRRALEVGALKLHCTGLEPLRPERVGVASPASWPEERVPADFLMVCASLDSEPRSQIPFGSGQSFSRSSEFD